MNRLLSVALVLACMISCSAPGAAGGESIEWQDLLAEGVVQNWQPSAFGISGRETIEPHNIQLTMGNPFTGVTWEGEPLPTENYEIEVTARKVMGQDFFCGLTFQVGEAPCTFIAGGWGGSITGLSCIDGKDASENATRTFQRYDIGQDYTIRIRVEDHQVSVWLEDGLVVQQPRAGTEFSVRFETEPSIPLGIACYNTEALISACRIRRL